MKILTKIIVSLLLLSSCMSQTAVMRYADDEYKYDAAKAAYAEGKYQQASLWLGEVLAALKGSTYGEESLYMLAESNMKAKDYESAAMFFKKYYQSYPKGHYMEMARYNSGYALYKQTPDIRLDQTSTMEAINEYQSFLDYCPETTLKSQAQQVIYEMQDKLVRKEYLAAKLYYDLGTYTLNSIYGGNNYEACVITAQNALKDYPYASVQLREDLSVLILRAKYLLARHSVEEKRLERYRDTIDEYYAFQNDYPESKYLKEANAIFDYSERVVERKGSLPEEDELSKKKKNDDAKEALKEMEESEKAKKDVENLKQQKYIKKFTWQKKS